MFASSDERSYDRDMVDKISPRQREILVFIESQIVDRGYPPSVREIGEAVGLTSPSTVHTHLNTLERLGFIRRDPTKPRAIEVRWDSNSGVAMERRPVRHVPLVGDVAAGTDVLAQENVEEILPLPQDFTGDGELFMLRVRGESMVDLGIFDGDYIVASQQPKVLNGDIAVVGIPGGEATVKTYRRDGDTVTLDPCQHRHGADDLPRLRGRALRPRGHGAAPALTRPPAGRDDQLGGPQVGGGIGDSPGSFAGAIGPPAGGYGLVGGPVGGDVGGPKPGGCCGLHTSPPTLVLVAGSRRRRRPSPMNRRPSTRPAIAAMIAPVWRLLTPSFGSGPTRATTSGSGPSHTEHVLTAFRDLHGVQRDTHRRAVVVVDAAVAVEIHLCLIVGRTSRGRDRCPHRRTTARRSRSHRRPRRPRPSSRRR